MKKNDVKRKLLLDSIKETVITSIGKSLEDPNKIKKRTDILIALDKEVNIIFSSDAFIVEPIDFETKDEFERYILEKSNELRLILIEKINKNNDK